MKQKTLKIVVKGIPASKSNSYRIGVRGKFGYLYKTKKLKEWEEKVLEAAEEAVEKIEWPVSDKDIYAKVKVFYPDQRRRDLDGTFKALFDVLNGIAYNDDSQIQKILGEKTIDKKNPRVEISIKEM